MGGAPGFRWPWRPAFLDGRGGCRTHPPRLIYTSRVDVYINLGECVHQTALTNAEPPQVCELRQKKCTKIAVKNDKTGPKPVRFVGLDSAACVRNLTTLWKWTPAPEHPPSPHNTGTPTLPTAPRCPPAAQDKKTEPSTHPRILTT